MQAGKVSEVPRTAADQANKAASEVKDKSSDAGGAAVNKVVEAVEGAKVAAKN